MLRALHGLGFDWEAFEYFAFILDAVGGAPKAGGKLELQIMYGIGGETDLTESTLDHLSGYGGARPVRIGNGAYDQQQHDVWGMLLDSVAEHQRNGGQIAHAGVGGHRRARRHRDRAVPRTRPGHLGDAGRAEALRRVEGDVLGRGRPRRAASRAHRDDTERAERWQKAADEIKAEMLAKGVDDRGVFRQHYDTDDLDASLLLIPIMGFLPADDERVRATVLAIADELTKDDLVLRYRVESTDDGLSGEEGTFTICSFWLVVGARAHRRGRAGPEAVPEAAVVRRPAAPLRGGDRHDHRPAPRQLPAGVHPPRADRRRRRGSSPPNPKTDHRHMIPTGGDRERSHRH